MKLEKTDKREEIKGLRKKFKEVIIRLGNGEDWEKLASFVYPQYCPCYPVLRYYSSTCLIDTCLISLPVAGKNQEDFVARVVFDLVRQISPLVASHAYGCAISGSVSSLHRVARHV